MLLRVHHYRVNVNGPHGVVEAVVRELTSAGARPADHRASTCLLVTSADGLAIWQSLSIRHPEAILGLECFEAFGDEMVHAVVENGCVTVMSRQGVLPQDYGSFHHEDGQRLDEELLRAAAESVAAQRMRHDVGTLSGGLDTALTIAKALGRFCRRVEQTAFEQDAPREALDAIVELGVYALWVSACRPSLGPAEREFEHALRLAQSMVHAGRDELEDEPGSAGWGWWLHVLIGSASNVIDAACHCSYEAETDAHAFGAEHYPTACERLELEGRSLLTTCLQALALFDAAPRSPRGAR